VAKFAKDQTVKSAKADLDKALLDLKTIDVRSAIEKERFQLAVEEAQARYKQALEEIKLFDASQAAQMRNSEIELQQAKIELQRAQLNVDRMVLKAPIDGIVVMQTIVRGGEFGQIRKGDQIASGMFFMSIVDPSSMVVLSTVNQADSEALRLGQKAQVHLDAYPELELPATITGIGAMTKPGGWRANWVRELPVRLKLDRIEPRVIPDLTASADVVLASQPNTLIVPREALFQDSGSPFVYLRGPAGWIRREVEIGLENNIAVSVRGGLRKGDVLAAQRPQG
jgi:multidrug resistance efflux pump